MRPREVEFNWSRLLGYVRSGNVVPVIGTSLLLDSEGRPLYAKIARQLQAAHPGAIDGDGLPANPDLHDVVGRLRTEENQQELYMDVDDAIRSVVASGAAVLEPIRQLAEIADFKLFVTLTPDDLLVGSLKERRAPDSVFEVVHSLMGSSDLPPAAERRNGQTHVLYLFGKAGPHPTFAIHEEDVLEYAHNLVSRHKQTPNLFLDQLLASDLLLIGCNFSDWLGRLFLRTTSRNRLTWQPKQTQEWLVEPLAKDEPLSCFLSSYSRSTKLVADLSPVRFVAELHRRWMLGRPSADTAEAPKASRRPSATFFVSYSRTTDRAKAEALVRHLYSLGARDHEVWFDQRDIDPGQNFENEIFDGIANCRHFVPLVSRAADARREAFFFRECRRANDRREGFREEEFVLPLVVDDEYKPESYTADAIRDWRKIDFGHAPDGTPNERTSERLRVMLRAARLERS